MHLIRKSFLFVFALGSICYSAFSLYKIIITFAPDFSVYYHAALNLMHSKSLYTNISFTLFAYPPLSTFFYVPLTLFPYQIAQTLFLLTSYACIFLSVVITFKLLDKKPKILTYGVTVALFLLSFPTKFTLGMGQSNIIALTIFLGSVLLQRQKREILSGILLAAAIIFKPIFIILLLYFFGKRLWKVLLMCFVTGLGVTLLQILLTPYTLSAWLEYITHVLPGLMTTVGREVYYNQGLLGTISRVTTNILLRQIIEITGMVSFLGIIAWGTNHAKKDSNWYLAIIFCLLPMVDSLSWQHHFVVLLFPVLYLGHEIKSASLYIVLALSYLLVSFNIKNPQNITHFPSNILLSHVFWGTCILLGLLLYTWRLQRHKGITFKTK